MWPPIIGTLSGILKKWLREEDPREGTKAIQQGIIEIKEALATHADHMILLIDVIQADPPHRNSRLESIKDEVKKSRRPPPNTSSFEVDR